MHIKALCLLLVITLWLPLLAMKRTASEEELDCLLSTKQRVLQRSVPLAPCFMRTTNMLRYKKIAYPMPDAARLRKRLDYYAYFLSHSDFVERIASKSLTPLEIVDIHEQSLTSYVAFIKTQGWSEFTIEAQRKFHYGILSLLLKDHPQALDTLILMGYVKPDQTYYGMETHKKTAIEALATLK